MIESLRKLTTTVLQNSAVKAVAEGSVVSTLSGALDSVFSRIFEIVDTRVVAARPTVQKYVSIAQPYIETAVEVSQPIINRASPYVERTKQVGAFLLTFL
jgi:hypothetical protein